MANPPVGFVASAGLGPLLGMQHALEPDHLAAVSTLMTGERSSAKAAWLGACWGLGHTLTLLASGTALVVLRAEMPAIRGRGLRARRDPVAGRIRPARAVPGRRSRAPTSNALTRKPGAVEPRSASTASPLRGRWWWAPSTGWLEAARSRRWWWPRSRRRRLGSVIWPSSALDPPWGWWRCRVSSAGRSREWDRIVRSCARSHWPLAACRPCSVCSGAGDELQ